ncbi:hypothetical protein [Alteromonas australica]|uniref:Uncharacterized protein n=1 Tax=Alteromonas australica TaxID=589873 RepID=A0A075NXP3_9ALTE|nr:hypothetical protein [Alteromonas australica]AIF98281.1 hypothetical protein EP13_05965 [Alteromonas australica]
MELKDFVQESLLSIIDAVHDAQDKAMEKGAIINPGGLTRGTQNLEANSVWDNTTNNYARNVNFDIAITAEDQAKGGAKIKVLSGLLGGDVGGEKSSKNSIASRIQFNVPILLPSINVEDDEARAKSIVVSKRKRT